MRAIFNEELDAIAADVNALVEGVRVAINDMTQALLFADLDAAQRVITNDTRLDTVQQRITDQCVRLLAQQNPVATDLRVVVSAMRLSTTLERMGDLASHICEEVRRAYPERAIREPVLDVVGDMAMFLKKTADRLVTMMATRDLAIAETIIREDDTLDKLHAQTFTLLLDDAWHGTKQELIDAVLISRFLERLGDHAVSIAQRIAYIVSGFNPSKRPDEDHDNSV